MIFVVVTALVLSLVVISCVRHFLIHLMAFKLFFDCVILLLSRSRSNPGEGPHFEATAWLVAALSSLVFFALIVMATRKFAQQQDLNLENADD